jgi:uncharacterized protein YkwD
MKSVPLPPWPADGDARRRTGVHRQPDRALSARHERLFYARPRPCAAPSGPAAAVQNRSRRFCALRTAIILLLLCPAAALANAIGAVNRARTAYCGVVPGTARPSFIESRKLDEIARLLAQGESLDQAQIRAGYRAVRSVLIRISGADDDAAVEQLVGQRFCGQISAPGLRHIGTYGSGESVLWIVVAQPFTTPPVQDAAAVSRLVLALTNQARAHARACGWRRFPPAPPLSLARALTRAALAHSRDMTARDFFSHTGSDGSTPGERATRAGYRWRMVGENIASGVRTPREVVAGWLASPHHCANIMTAGFRQMGVAFAVNPASTQGIDWTQDFGAPLRSPSARD